MRFFIVTTKESDLVFVRELVVSNLKGIFVDIKVIS